MEILKDLIKRFWQPICIGILLFMLSSCGSRKVNKSVIEQETKQETTTSIVDTSKTTTNTVENTKIVDTSNCEEIEFIPVDNSKPMTINGKTYFNTILKQKKRKSNISIVKDKKVSQIEDKAVNIKVKEELKQTTKVDTKNIDKKPLPFWHFLFLLLSFLGLVLLLFIYRKKRNNESQ